MSVDIKTLVAEAHSNAVAKGFYENPPEFGTRIALITSELSEALEAHRHNDMDNLAEELADTVIRIADTCGHMGIDLEEAILKKMIANRARPHKHGKAY